MTVHAARTWLDRLEAKLEQRKSRIATYDAYYDGQHPLEFASDKFRATFGGLFDEFADNWCQVVADAPEERLNVIGFRFGDDPKADQDANRFWQDNQMDAQSQLGHTEALVNEEASVLVWPDAGDAGRPRMWVEHPSQMAVAVDNSRTRVRLAAVKIWDDEWGGGTFATVYLPDGIYKFKKVKRTTSTQLVVVTYGQGEDEWAPREVDGETWPLKNPLGTVPVVPLPNRPRLLKPPVSEIRNVIPLQNVVNKLITDMLVASELGAMPARWIAGWELPRDKETNQPIPPKVTDYLNRFLTLEDSSARAGTFSQAQLDMFVKAIEMIVQHIAAQTRTPRHYLIQHGQEPSGDSIKGAETGLVRKTQRKQFHLGEGWEEAVRLCFAVIGDPRATIPNAETIWRDAETRSASEHIDSVQKKAALGVPPQQLWEDAGYTPEQIARFPKMWAQFNMQQRLAAGGGAPAALLTPPGQDTGEGEG